MGDQSNPLVSVVVPVYNCGKFIDRCLGSLVSQSYKNIEIIAVNDGSSDESLSIIKTFSDSDERVRLIDQKNTGVGTARNNGVSASSGDYLLFVDGDDYADGDYIEVLVNEALANNTDLVISGYTEEKDDFSVIRKVIPQAYKKDEEEMWAYHLMATWGRLYKRTFWDENGLRFTSEKNARAEDVPVCLTSNYLGSDIRVVKNAGYHYIQHEGSAMKEFAGLGKYGFPVKAFEELAVVIKKAKVHNSRDALVYAVIKTFAQFKFVFFKGADKAVKKELQSFFTDYVYANMPDYRICCRRVRKTGLPVHVRAAVLLYEILLTFQKPSQAGRGDIV